MIEQRSLTYEHQTDLTLLEEKFSRLLHALPKVLFLDLPMMWSMGHNFELF